MFIFKLSSFLDRYDPYWYSRLMALKVTYITIILFIANFLFHPPMASLVMILSGAGIALIEMPTINEHRKKDLVYFAYIVLIVLAVGLFSSYVYLRGYFVLVVAAFAFVLYHALRKAPQLFPIVSVILMLSFISLEGFNSGNFYTIFNTLIFVIEFAVIVFWAHKLFPNYYNFIWLSSALRSVESWQQMLNANSSLNNSLLFKHLQVMQSSMSLLKPKKLLKPAEEFCAKLSYYQYYLIDLLGSENVKKHEIKQIQIDLTLFREALVKQKPVLMVSYSGDADNHLLHHHQLFNNLQLSWNQLCIANSN